MPSWESAQSLKLATLTDITVNLPRKNYTLYIILANTNTKRQARGPKAAEEPAQGKAQETFLLSNAGAWRVRYGEYSSIIVT